MPTTQFTCRLEKLGDPDWTDRQVISTYVCVRSTALPGSGVVNTTFCAVVIVQIGLRWVKKIIRAISRLRKQTMDPGFAQDNPGIAQIHALRVT